MRDITTHKGNVRNLGLDIKVEDRLNTEGSPYHSYRFEGGRIEIDFYGENGLTVESILAMALDVMEHKLDLLFSQRLAIQHIKDALGILSPHNAK